MPALSIGRAVTRPIALRKGALATYTRSFASQASTVPLKFDKLVPPNGNETERPLVIMHGFLYVLLSYSINLLTLSPVA